MSTENPIRRVSAKGDPFSIGYALGQAAGADIRERVFVTEEFRELANRWMNTDYLRVLEDAARATYPDFVREIEGIAAGAGQDFETAFLWNCRGDLRFPENVSAETLLRSASGCTSVMIPASEGDGPAIIAHNEDGPPEFSGHCFWVSVTPDEGPSFESFMYPGMLPGHTFGVNSAGIVQTINNIRAHDLKPGVPRHVVCRAILASSKLDDAIDILKGNDRASGFHHNLGQAGSRRVVSVEAPASGCQAREITAPAAHANHLTAEMFANVPQLVTASSNDRQTRADSMINDGVLAKGEGPEAILFECGAPIYRANDDGDDYSQTLATGLFELFADCVAWRIHATPDEWNSLDGTIKLDSAPCAS